MVKVQFFLSRAILVLSGLAVILFLISQSLSIYMAWSYSELIKPVQRHTDYLRMLESFDFELRKTLLDMNKSENGNVDLEKIQTRIQIHQNKLNQLINSKAGLSKSKTTLESVRQQLDQFENADKTSLAKTLHPLRFLLNQELNAHQTSMTSLYSDAEKKFSIAIALAGSFLIIAILLWFLVHQRIVNPLKNLTNKMSLLARQNYTELDIEDADPMLSEIIKKYNYMANRLKLLEEAKQKREDCLTREVRNTSYMLLQQQYRMSQVERLGAVGELAAGIAHELRNPLTGVKMALDNIKTELQDNELAERVDLIADEVTRVNQQLNHLLDQARQKPELPIVVNIEEDLKTLITLVTYQLPDHVTIDYEIDSQLRCCLPRNQLHQALLNLLLNAGQALKDKPGKIELFIKEEDGIIKFIIQDNGPGFPDIMLSAGIQPFLSIRSGGTGLGLVMIRRTITNMGGEIQISNRDKGGACVILKLPCNQNG